MKKFVLSLLVSATAALGFGGAAQAQDGYFRMTSNDPQAGGFSLDVGDAVGNGMQAGLMLPTGQASGQYWLFKPTLKGGLKFTNQFLGVNQCLDVAGDGTTYMDVCGAQIGQQWVLEEVLGQGVRILNAYKIGQCLDYQTVFSNPLNTNIGIAKMAPCNGTPSQIWTIGHTGRF